MPKDPLTAIWRRLDREPPLFFGDQLEDALAGARDRVFALGLLRAAGTSANAPCRACGLVGRVKWEEHPVTGALAAALACRACGSAEFDPEAVRQWAIDVPALVAAVRAAGRLHGAATEVTPGHVWHLGTATWAGRRRDAYLIRCAHEAVKAGCAAAVATRPRAVLLFPTEEAAHKWGRATDNPTAALESVTALGAERLEFDAPAIEARLADAVPPEPVPRTLPKRASRAANIAVLTDALIQFLRAARDHARSTQQLTGTPDLLPRPSKTDLAREAKLDKAAVTKCFKDRSARELRLYWDVAADLDRIMAFNGPVSAG